MEKHKKIAIRVPALIMALACVLSLTSCFSDRGTLFDDVETLDFSDLTGNAVFEYDKLKHFSNGLELILSEDGSYYILSSGKKCADESISIPESYNGKPIAEIAESAFSGNTAIKNITIPESIIRIGGSAFYGCVNLEYNVYDNAKYLGSGNNPYAFLIASMGEGISSIDFHSDLRVIGACTFYNHDNLVSISLPDSLISVGKDAFSSCSNLKDVDFGNGVKYIDDTAFSGTALTEIRLPDSVISIGDETFGFSTASRIDVLELGNLIESIGEYAFDRVNQETVILPDSLLELGQGAFTGGTFKKLVIGDGLKGIKFWTFAHCESLEMIEFGTSIEYLEDNAFYNCSSLRDIKLPKSLKKIDVGAFDNCDSLKYNEYGGARYLGSEESDYDCLMSVGDDFDGSLVLHPDVRIIVINSRNFKLTTDVIMEGAGKYFSVVDNCVIDSATKTLIFGTNNSVIPNDGSVRAIGDYAFYQRTLLKSLTLPEGVVSIGDYAFFGCDSLSDIKYNAELESIGDFAFAYNREMTSPDLPEGIKRIGESAFNGCVKITEIHIPGSVREIGREAFAFCYGAVKASIGEGVITLSDYLFHDCNVMTDVTFPSTLKVINTAAFRQCRVLSDIELPEGLLYIENYAFEICSQISEVSLPKSLLGVGEKAFSQCKQIKRFTFNAGLREIGNDVLRYISSEAKVDYTGTVEMWEKIDNHDNIIRGKDDMKVICHDGEAMLTPDEYPPEPMW